MSRRILTSSLGLLVLALVVLPANGQRGRGDTVGIARQGVRPEVTRIAGELIEIKTGRCEATTGRAAIGTHLILQSESGKKLNLHLGPANSVEKIVAGLKIGQQVAADVFRTEKHVEGDYVAVRLLLDEKSVSLRDDSLRPTWANGGQRRGGRGRGNGWGYGGGRGQGYGQGRRNPNCPGRGYGACWGAQADTPPRVTPAQAAASVPSN